MALTLRVVNVNNNIGFDSSSCSRSTFVSPNPSKFRSNSFVFRCSQVEQLSITESENSLIEALVGIQGRGRSTSPQQLNVSLSCSFFLTLSFHFSHLNLFHFLFRLLSVLFKSSKVWEGVFLIRFVSLSL
jgi:hypothetical protein